MIEQNKVIEGGLKRERKDPRDFSFGGVFGKVEVPIGDFTVAEPLEIKDQEINIPDGCTGYSLSAVSEDQEEVTLSPEFTFAMIKKIQGNWKSWGGGLREGCKSAVKIGFIEKSDVPFVVSEKDRNFLANWNNWPWELQLKAQKHAKQSFLRVDEGPDRFEAIRSALWANRGQKQSVYTGCTWRPGWLGAPNGVIPKEPKNGGVGHAIKAFGIKYINGEPYLMIQNSYGIDVGDKGIFYFPRSVVNREFTYGAYQFIDLPQAEIKGILREKGLLIETKPNFLNSFWQRIKEIF